jgi:hypothetical protein
MNATENTQTRLLTPAELRNVSREGGNGRRSNWLTSPVSTCENDSAGRARPVRQSQHRPRYCRNAFEFEDIDALNKPRSPFLRRRTQGWQKKFDREHVTLTAIPLTEANSWPSSRKSAQWTCRAGFELTREVDKTFAALADYFRDYRNCTDVYSETQKFDVYDEMQSHRRAQNVRRVVALRRTQDACELGDGEEQEHAACN